MFSYEPLFIQLVEKGMTKTQFRKAVGIATTTLAKMSKKQYVSMSIINDICTYLDCNIEDVIRFEKDDALDKKNSNS